MKNKLRNYGLSLLTAGAALYGATATVQAADKKPNIVFILGDDVGVWNISAYHRGMMGGRTPNIDKLATQGALFTDYYAQQSCTAGRAAFILGQSPFRTGLLKVGLPGAKQGIQDKDATIAELLKTQGYATAQIGKNHLGNRNEFLPSETELKKIWGDDGYFTARSMDVYLTKLRKLFTEDPLVEIRNIHGSGFMLEIKKQ